MEDIVKMFEKIQCDVNETKAGIKSMEINITKNIDEKFCCLQNSIQNLEEEIEEKEKRLQYLEKKQRQRNIILFGVTEGEKSYSQLENKVLDIINNYIKIESTKAEIEAVKRVGRKGEKVRPVVVTLCTLGKKIEILKHKHNLKKTTFSMAEDYPQNVLETRKKLQETMKLEREKGNKVFIRYDKLIILHNSSEEQSETVNYNDKSIRFHTPKNKNSTNKEDKCSETTQKLSSKRLLSPEDTNSPTDTGNRQMKKKNKNLMTSYIRSRKVSESTTTSASSSHAELQDV